MNVFLLFRLVLLTLLFYCCDFKQSPIIKKAQLPKTIEIDNTSISQPDYGSYYSVLQKLSPEERQTRYLQVLDRMTQRRKILSSQLDSSDNIAVTNQARLLMINYLCDSLFPHWYMTPWDFNGMTMIPGQGQIACGYFVTNTLQQTGFRFDRIWLAQQASSILIRKFCAANTIKIITNHQTSKLISYLQTQPDGVYIIGLDVHTGYIVKSGDRLDMVHSSYWPQKCVAREPMASSAIILESTYYMIGSVTGSDATMLHWLRDEAI